MAAKKTASPKPKTYKTFSELAKASVDKQLPLDFHLVFDGGYFIASHGIRFAIGEQDLMDQALAMFGIKTSTP